MNQLKERVRIGRLLGGNLFQWIAGEYLCLLMTLLMPDDWPFFPEEES
jgi:hypothetical protein